MFSSPSSRRPARAAFLFCLLASFATSLSAYHLELEAYPAAVFPYFQKFGSVDLHVYPGGVRADTMWLDAFSRNGSSHVTIMNPLARMYTDVPIAELAAIITRLGNENDVERNAVATLGPMLKGRVGSFAAIRYRLVFGDAYIDYWTTTAVPENPQLRKLVSDFVAAISPGTAAVVKKIAGTPIYVEVNFRRFKKVVMLRPKRLSASREDEAKALAVGPYYMRAPMIEAIWK